MLDFIYAMQRYHVDNQALMEPILIEACQGKMEREWCASVDFDFTKVMCKLVKWMTNRKDWLLVRLRLEEGVKLNEDLEKHLKYFGMIAKYAHMEAESDRTKRLLLLSLGGTVRMSEAKDGSRKFKRFKAIARMAMENKQSFNHSSKEKSKITPSREGERRLWSGRGRRP